MNCTSQGHNFCGQFFVICYMIQQTIIQAVLSSTQTQKANSKSIENAAQTSGQDTI